MKIKSIAAIVIAAGIITFISCNWFRSKPHDQAFNIEGKWLVDSVENRSGDSSKNIGLLAFALAAKDSLPLGFQFNNDSSYHYLNTKDSTTGKYYVTADQSSLYVKEDSVFYQLNFVTKNDSAFSVIIADSIYLQLKKQ